MGRNEAQEGGKEEDNKITLISNKVRIFNFLNANVKGDIECSQYFPN